MPGLTEHLREAIEINTARAPRYAVLTDSRSLPLSRLLIRAERASLPAAWATDRWGARFQAAGIPVVWEEYVPMALGPFVPYRTPPKERFVAADGAALAAAMWSAWGEGRFEAVALAADAYLPTLQEGYHAMVRHLLESIRRAAQLAPLHHAQALALGVESPKLLSAWMVCNQFPLLPRAASLDARAAPLQATGVPFLLQDLPHIPPASHTPGPSHP